MGQSHSAPAASHVPSGSLAVVTGWFVPLNDWNCSDASRATTLPSLTASPHPLGASNSFVITNSKCPLTNEGAESSWTVLYAPDYLLQAQTSPTPPPIAPLSASPPPLRPPAPSPPWVCRRSPRSSS